MEAKYYYCVAPDSFVKPEMWFIAALIIAGAALYKTQLKMRGSSRWRSLVLSRKEMVAWGGDWDCGDKASPTLLGTIFHKGIPIEVDSKELRLVVGEPALMAIRGHPWPARPFYFIFYFHFYFCFLFYISIYQWRDKKLW